MRLGHDLRRVIKAARLQPKYPGVLRILVIDPVPASRAEVAKRGATQIRWSLKDRELATNDVQRVRRNDHCDAERACRKLLTILTMARDRHNRLLAYLIANAAALAGPGHWNVHLHLLLGH